MESQPNLFFYASKELSQDAFICWLMDWRTKNMHPWMSQCTLWGNVF